MRFHSQRGFTLVEMAITLAIVAFLLGGLMLTLSTQQRVSREQETRRLLNDAREALYGFAMRNGRLPCPADATLPPNNPAAGVEVGADPTGCIGGAAALEGALPWVTLGVPQSDAWARRLRYRVTAEFARTVSNTRPNTQFACPTAAPNPNPNPPVAPTQSAYALCTPGVINIRTSGGTSPVTLGAIAVIVSHGANGSGGRTVDGVAVPNSSYVNEIENHDGDLEFRDASPADTYDDMVEWITPAILMNRMVQAGRLP